MIIKGEFFKSVRELESLNQIALLIRLYEKTYKSSPASARRVSNFTTPLARRSARSLGFSSPCLGSFWSDTSINNLSLYSYATHPRGPGPGGPDRVLGNHLGFIAGGQFMSLRENAFDPLHRLGVPMSLSSEISENHETVTHVLTLSDGDDSSSTAKRTALTASV